MRRARFPLRGNPFFEPLGSNGRACVTCHQPASGMGLSVETIRRRWQETRGKDPLFAAIDGANCPKPTPGSGKLALPAAAARVVSGLAALAAYDRAGWQPGQSGVHHHGRARPKRLQYRPGVRAEQYQSAHLGVSPSPRGSQPEVPRRRCRAQIYGGAGPFNAKRLGMVMDRDPDSGQFAAMNIMSDAREPSLTTQARAAARDHLQVREPLTEQQLRAIVKFESQVYAAQGTDLSGDDFNAAGAPPALGAAICSSRPVASSATISGTGPSSHSRDGRRAPQLAALRRRTSGPSVIRGYDVFFNRPFWIRDVTHINTVGLGNPAKRTCVTCHNLQMVGTDASAGWGDLGTTNEPWAGEAVASPSYDSKPDLPLFKVVCKAEARPHPFLGRVIFTHDPGRALISGKCYDVGSIVMASCADSPLVPPTSPAARPRTCAPWSISTIGASTCACRCRNAPISSTSCRCCRRWYGPF